MQGLLCSMLCAQHSTCISSFHPHNHPAMITLIFQMRKLKHRGVK